MSTVPSLLLTCLCLATPTSSLKVKNCWNGISKKVGIIRGEFSLPCVAVYDDVIEGSLLKAVDVQLKQGGLGHTVFLRDSPPRTSVEAVIHSILTAAGDKSIVVEYWWREEWMNLEMHRDLDEKLALQQGPIRFPNHAHVLYLSVGDDVRGPTMVYHDSAVDLISGKSLEKTFDRITVVPAVSGRLLRFTGDMMHSVPRPPLAYLDPSEGGTNLELWTRRRPTDENDPELNNYRRSVLLFNTWTGVPPNEIPLEPPSGTVDRYRQYRSEQTERSKRSEQIDELEVLAAKKIGQLVGMDQCRPIEEWKSVPPQPNNNKPEHDDNGNNDSIGDDDENNGRNRLIRLKVGLLGDIRRRERSERYLNMYVSSDIRDSLISEGRQLATFPLLSAP